MGLMGPASFDKDSQEDPWATSEGVAWGRDGQGQSRKCELWGEAALETEEGLRRQAGCRERALWKLGRLTGLGRLQWSLQQLHPFFYPRTPPGGSKWP